MIPPKINQNSYIYNIYIVDIYIILYSTESKLPKSCRREINLKKLVKHHQVIYLFF
jgi:hypothetical protein